MNNADIKQAQDWQLVVLMGKGEKKAFEELYDRYYKKLVYFIYYRTNDMQFSEDIVQDVFLKLIERPGIFDVNRTFSTWIYTVTVNASNNADRNNKNRERLLNNEVVHLHPKVTSNGNDIDSRLMKGKIEEALKSMSEKERSVYILRFVEGLSIADISTITGIPQGSVKSCIFYLLKKLREHLNIFNHG